MAIALFAVVSAATAPRLSAQDQQEPARRGPRLRYPIRVQTTSHPGELVVANRNTGSVSVVDSAARVVRAEFDVAHQIADMATTPDGRHLLVADDAADELLLLAIDDGEIANLARLEVPGGPVTIAVAPDGSQCAVAALWARRVMLVELTPDANGSERLAVAAQIELPFAPREQVYTSDGARLIVAGSYRAELAVIDSLERRLISSRRFEGHNIRGMAIDDSNDELVITYQILKEQLGTTRENILWADLMRNVLRRIPLAPLCEQPSQATLGGYPQDLGILGNAGGDPDALAVTGEGTLVVALSGVHQIALVDRAGAGVVRVPVGRRPTDVLVPPGTSSALVANTFDDSISVVDVSSAEVVDVIRLGRTRRPTTAEQGEQLFYDATLSLHGWYSCHSCHSEGHASGLVNDNKSDGSFGAPKRVLSLLGVRDTAPWAWRGTVQHLEDQIHQSTQSTMVGRQLDDEQTAALVAYLETLASPPPAAQFHAPADLQAAARGQAVFERHQCDHCHRPPFYTSSESFDVGLVDEVGNRKFNPPSLRGVSQRTPLLHDGRAETLEEVFTQHHHPRGLELSGEELADLVAFLRGL